MVDSVSTQTSNNASVSVNYQYGGLLLHKKGRGLLGFEVLRTTDNQTGVISETTYHQHWPYIGMPRSTIQKKDHVTLSLATNELAQKTTASGGVMPYIHNTTELMNSLGSDNNQYNISKTQSTFTYDSYGNVTRSTVIVSDAENSNNKLITTTTNTYGSSALYRQKGRLTYSTVNKRLFDNGSLKSNISRQSGYSYYSGSLLLKTSILSPENNKTKQTTTYIYDNAGNKIETWLTAATDSNGQNMQTRKSYTVYDSRYRYVDLVKNHLQETTTFRYNGSAASSVTGVIDYVETIDSNGLKVRKYQNLIGQPTLTRLYGKSEID